MPRSPTSTAVPCRFMEPAPIPARAASETSLIGWQGDDEAGAANLAGLAAWNVLGRQRASMAFHDLPADRQAKPRILAERLACRAVGVEALENAFDIVGTDARSIVLDREDVEPARARQGNGDLAAILRHEGTRIVDEVGDDLAKPQIVPLHEIAFSARRQLGDLELQLERLLVVRDFARNRNQVSNELLEVHLFGILAGKLGVKPRRIRNIGDEAVQPAHIVLDDLQKPRARGIGPGERERFHCAAQRSERVLQLMADIRGKALDRIYAGVKRIGHLTHGYGKVAD